MIRYVIETDDLGLATALHAHMAQLQGTPALVGIGPAEIPQPVPQPAPAPLPLPVPAAAPLPAPVPAPAPAPVPAAPLPAPVTAPAPLPAPVTAPAPVAAAPVGVDPALMVAPPGWTIDIIKTAGNAYVQKHGMGGAAAFAKACLQYCPPGTTKPGVGKVLPAYWPNLYQDLTA